MERNPCMNAWRIIYMLFKTEEVAFTLSEKQEWYQYYTWARKMMTVLTCELLSGYV